ncbi:hypothetical protein Vadar_031080 [Vaccinium darrowii]|uniref:Uncharacterized protein n=1 Tax=Vaccinium darrowii TaxID=229202 RepID=A0ACB7Y4L9_9ERIC|nr:hypothetical protein Vadar_031080 [Vaccinium darrowii]
MAPQSKKSSASSNSTCILRRTAAVPNDTIATTPVLQNAASTPLGASPSSHTSVDNFKVTEKESLLGEDIENGNERTYVIEEAFNAKANLRYKEWKHTMGDRYWKMMEADEVDPYQHPYRGISMDEWKWLIDNIFIDPDWQDRKAAGHKYRAGLVISI